MILLLRKFVSRHVKFIDDEYPYSSLTSHSSSSYSSTLSDSTTFSVPLKSFEDIVVQFPVSSSSSSMLVSLASHHHFFCATIQVLDLLISHSLHLPSFILHHRSLLNSEHTDPDLAHIPISPHFTPLNSEPSNSVSPNSISILPLQDHNPYSSSFPSNLPIHSSSTSLPNTHVMTTRSKNGIHKPKHQFSLTAIVLESNPTTEPLSFLRLLGILCGNKLW